MLTALFTQHFGVAPVSSTLLPQSGSNRKYYRMVAPDGKAYIGVIGENDRENAAFVSFAKSLRGAGIRVPEVVAQNLEAGIYIQQDLGSLSLYDFLLNERKANGGAFTPALKEVYKKVLVALLEIQNKGRNVIDFDKCYPREIFDKQSMAWDLQYFKYYFLKLAGVAFDEQKLEADFEVFMNYLLQANGRYFLYRDFQSRNIMLDANLNPWFIDFQGGRRGPRQYDVASLLYDAKADIPAIVRNELLGFYVSRMRSNEAPSFSNYFYGFCIMRILQAMGAYGYRGYFERKQHFLKSIPFAQANLRDILAHHCPEINAPELIRVLHEVANSKALSGLGDDKPVLRVDVSSFSYKHGIPVDVSGNGGGFVFDCRALPNPGREERYKKSTGRDADVKAFFAEHKEPMAAFLSAAKQLVGASVNNYLHRGFAHLAVNFGCTGGQHRSVFCADAMAQWLKAEFPKAEIVIKHHEQPQLG